MVVWYAGRRSEQIALVHVKVSITRLGKLNALRFQNGLPILDQQPQEQDY
jgi:hypothetical protein